MKKYIVTAERKTTVQFDYLVKAMNEHDAVLKLIAEGEIETLDYQIVGDHDLKQIVGVRLSLHQEEAV
jgi:hypothetical protein